MSDPAQNRAPLRLDEALKHAVARVEEDAGTAASVIRRFGWDGLDPAGPPVHMRRAVDLGHERVKHAVNRAIVRLRDDDFMPEAVGRSLALIERSLPLLDVEIWEALMEARLCFIRLSCEALASVGWCFRNQSPFEVIQLGPRTGLVRTGTAKNRDQLVLRIDGRMRSYGCANIADVVGDVQEILGNKASMRFAEAAIRSGGRFEWLDQDEKWFWYIPNREPGANRLVDQIQRVLAATPRIELRDLRSAIRRVNGLGEFAPPSKVLEAICRRLLFVQIEGGTIVRVPGTAPWDAVISTQEKVLIEVLQSRILEHDTFRELCRQRGVDERVFSRLISDSPVLCECDGRYALVGTKISSAPLDNPEVLPKAPSPKSRHGFLREGQVFLAWTLDASAFRGGALRMPEPINTFAEGDYRLKTITGRELGPLNIRQRACWDVRRLLLALGAEVEDTLVLVLNLRDHTAIGVAGEEDVIDSVKSRVDEIAAANAACPSALKAAPCTTSSAPTTR
jgi:hypothetical protein